MRKQLIGLVLLHGMWLSSVCATEFRSPYLSERGPIRYKFDKFNVNSKKWIIDSWYLIQRREAHKAYDKHGTSTKPLTSLFFNKSDFTIAQAFPNSKTDPNSKYYNPFLELMTISPRATYYEWGSYVGGRLEYKIYKNKGRIGLRANVPFRNIEIQRDDITDKNADPSRDFVLRRTISVGTGADNNTPVGARKIVTVPAYNLGLVKRLFQDSVNTPALQIGKQFVKVFGQDITYGLNLSNAADKKMVTNMAHPMVGVIYNAPDNNFPTEPAISQKWAFNSEYDANLTQAERKAHWVNKDGSEPNGISIALSNPQGGGGADDTTYINGIAFFSYNDEAGNALTYNISDDQFTNMWLVMGYENGILSGQATNVVNGIENALKLYQEDPYQWMLSKGNYELETNQRHAIGDVDLDFFYEHKISKYWIGEVFVGVRIPTSGSKNYFESAYYANSGNGDHWEVKLGGMLDVKPAEWFNAKLDLYGSYVIRSKEHRCAVFTGSQIKNMGPRVDANVDWWYFVTNLDFNMKSEKIKGFLTTAGYEFYYKGEDSIKFKQQSITPWYGDSIDGVTSLAAPLDNKLASKNTEAIAHKVRGELTYQINPWFDLFGGFAYTFAGQHVPRETDMHGGCNVRF